MDRSSRRSGRVVPGTFVVRGFVVVLVLVLSAGAWFFARERPPERSAGAKSVAASDAAVASSPTIVAERREYERPVAAVAAAPRRIAEPGPVGGLSVRVIDDRTGDPVAGAEVIVASRPTRRFEGPRSRWVDPEELRASAKAIYLADEQGEALLPWPTDDDAPRLYCFHRGLSGCAIVRSATSRLLRLHAPQRVDVRVVGSDGRPRAGVPVAFGAGFGNYGFYATTPAVRTGPDGIARIVGIELCDREWTSFWGVGVPDTIGGVPFERVDMDALPQDPIELSVPHTCELVVRLLDASGCVVDRGGSVMVTSADRKGHYASLAPLELDFVRGIARGAFARPGYVAYVSPLDPALDEPRFVEIPDDAGAELVVDFVASTAAPVLVGRVIDASRNPVAQRELWYRCREEACAVVTDGEGRFRLAVPAFVSNRYGCEGALLDVATDGREVGLARFMIPRRRVGEIDVGDVALVTQPLVAAGRVVDDAGAPVEGASFRWFVVDESRFDECADRMMSRQDRTGADGRFAWFGTVSASQLMIEVTCGARGGALVEHVRPGVDDLTIELTRARRVVGAFVADGWLPAGTLRVDLRDPADDSYACFKARNEEGGAFTISNVPPGRWNFHASLSRDGWSDLLPLFTILDVVVSSDDVVRDPRLQALDVRGLLPIRVRVCDERGNRIMIESSAIVRESRSGEILCQSRVWEGSKEILVEHPNVLVEARAPGFRHATLAPERGTTEFRLERGDDIRVHLALAEENARELAAEPGRRRLHLALVPKGSAPKTEFSWLRAELEHRDDVIFEIPEAGGWELRAHVGDGLRACIPVEVSPRGLEVADGDRLEVTISVPLEPLRAAIAEFARRE